MKAVLSAAPVLLLVAGCMSTEGADAPREGQSNGFNVATTAPVDPVANGPRRADVFMEYANSGTSNDPDGGSDETDLTGSTSISRGNIVSTVTIPTTNPSGTVTAGDRVFDPSSL